MLLNENISQIAIVSQKEKQGDLDIETSQKAKVVGDSHWQIRSAAKSPLNSKQLHKIINSERKYQKQKP